MDSKLLEQALLLARDILNSVDRQVDAREKEHELIEIYNKLDARSSALYKGKKFKVSGGVKVNVDKKIKVGNLRC